MFTSPWADALPMDAFYLHANAFHSPGGTRRALVSQPPWPRAGKGTHAAGAAKASMLKKMPRRAFAV